MSPKNEHQKVPMVKPHMTPLQENKGWNNILTDNEICQKGMSITTKTASSDFKMGCDRTGCGGAAQIKPRKARK